MCVYFTMLPTGWAFIGYEPGPVFEEPGQFRRSVPYTFAQLSSLSWPHAARQHHLNEVSGITVGT